MYHVYVIQNQFGRYYIGLTEDISVRLVQHNTGLSRWTRDRGPWTLVWNCDAMSLREARQLELKLKRQKGGRGFYQMTGIRPRVLDS